MSRLRRFNRRTFLTAAGAGVGTGLVGIAETSQAGKVVPYTRRELFDPGKERVFEGEHLGEIAFPWAGSGPAPFRWAGAGTCGTGRSSTAPTREARSRLRSWPFGCAKEGASP